MKEKKNFKGKTKNVLVFVVSVLIILGGFFTASHMIKTAPKARKRPPMPISALVEVEPMQLKDSNIKISAMGTAIPTNVLYLSPKISGIVSKLGNRYSSGYIVKKGEPLVYIEDIDQKANYELAEAALAQSEANLAIEIGSQAVAKRELDILQNSNIGNKIVFENEEESDLALRKPQLKIAQADMQIAKANLETAKNDLGYTVVVAPFNAFIDNKTTTVGMYVSPTVTLCELYDTDAFWIDATVTYETLKYLDIPDWNTDKNTGSIVDLHVKGIDGIVGTRQAEVRRMRGKLQDGDNMVRLLILLKDPFCLQEENKGKEMVLLSSKLDVEIKGKELKNIYEIPRSAWRDDKEIWIVGEGNKLKKLQPKLVWRTKNTVFIESEGIEDGTLIITSNLSLSVEGIALNIINKKEKSN